MRDGFIGRLFAQTKLPAHVTEEQDWYLDTPDVRLTRVFTIVLILHVVAVGGILAFKMIEKASSPATVATVSTPDATAAGRDNSPAPERTSTAPATAAQTEVALGSSAPPVSAPSGPGAGGALDESTPGVIRYRIAEGDNLVGIARKMGVSVAALKKENSISEGNEAGELYPSRWLQVTKDVSDKPAPAPAPETPPAESAAEIAGQSDRISNPSSVAPAAAPEKPAATELPAARRPGPAPAPAAEPAPAAPSRPTSYVVKKGDTAYGISRKFGIRHQDLMAANGIVKAETLQIGQVIKIPKK
ncbi:MAG: LysM peptidoglycan-binding domain-containing protein [Verrucomicrobiales bacterium]|nr:LysM peptidoglycan-binding domain-containing protein [Verrucomicrobiales bacterium]